MRSALFPLFCAAVCCAVIPSSTARAQVTPAQVAAASAADVNAASTGPVLLASVDDATFSSSLTGDSAVAGDATLPDAPSAAAPVIDAGQAGGLHAGSPQPIAPKYTFSILPGQGAVPLHAGDKVVFALRQQAVPFTMLSRVLSATWSQALDSQPHYGQGWAPYGQRVGASFARGAVQDLATMAVFDPIFRDDPRYYVLGRQHKFINRVFYAATRVVVTRTDSGHNTLNAPLLLGYAAAAGANMAYYPQRDRNFSDAATGYAGSLGGAVLGMEVNEFISDALHIVRLRRN